MSRPKNTTPCKVTGCPEPYWASGCCKTHYGNQQIRNYRKRNPEYVARHRERAREHMRQRRLEDPAFRVRQISRAKEWRIRLKNKVIQHYGGWVCACCGETERLFLQIDHINGGGRKELKAIGCSNGMTFYVEIRRKKFPPGYQVLCANCNMGKHLNSGTCPHQNSIRRTG